MAVKTNISTDDFMEILLHYNLGNFIEANPIAKGTVQTNFILRTTKTVCVFRYYENRSVESVTFEANLIHYLKQKEYPCPAPLKDKHGKFIGIYKNKPYVIFEFIEGVHIENPNESETNQLIKNVADLHNLTKSYQSQHQKDRANYDVVFCREQAKELSAKINSSNSREKLKWYIDQLNQLILPKTLAKGICHTDFHYTNIIYRDGQFIALIDFDDANYTYLTFDILCLSQPFTKSFEWNTWERFGKDDDVFDFTELKKVLAEYAKQRPINRNEKRHLFDVCKLHVLIDCLWYFERGDVIAFFEKRKIDHLDKLGRENFYKSLFDE